MEGQHRIMFRTVAQVEQSTKMKEFAVTDKFSIMPRAKKRVIYEQKLILPKVEEPGKWAVNDDKIKSELAIQDYMEGSRNLIDL